jgi:hypothetical protein
MSFQVQDFKPISPYADGDGMSFALIQSAIQAGSPFIFSTVARIVCGNSLQTRLILQVMHERGFIIPIKDDEEVVGEWAAYLRKRGTRGKMRVNYIRRRVQSLKPIYRITNAGKNFAFVMQQLYEIFPSLQSKSVIEKEKRGIFYINRIMQRH